jgi:hypothetical protein
MREIRVVIGSDEENVVAEQVELLYRIWKTTLLRDVVIRAIAEAAERARCSGA